MPCKEAKARHLLEKGRAEIFTHNPFTIRLTSFSTEKVQPAISKIDLGSKKAGIAVMSSDKVLHQAEVTLRDNIRSLLDQRRSYRRSRRNRKTRYRAPRFDNRTRPPGWLPPSLESKKNTIIKIAKQLADVFLITKIIVEISNFDTQALAENKDHLSNWKYQKGELYQRENIKMYVRARDHYTCQYCGEKNPPDLEVDHIIPISRGGTDRPSDMVAACHRCNQKKGNQTAEEFGYPGIQKKTQLPLKQAAQTQTYKTALLQELEKIAPTETTYGYITKINREKLGLPKTHYYDAVAMSYDDDSVKTLPCYDYLVAKPKGNYRLYKDAHSHIPNQGPKEILGFRRWDKVKMNEKIGFVKGRRQRGYFCVSDIDNKTILSDVSYKKLKLIERASALLKERRLAIPHSP